MTTKPSDASPRAVPMDAVIPHKILSKRDAAKATVASLFQAGSTLACLPKIRFDRAKYQKSVIGRDVPEHMRARVRLVWAEARQDKGGPFFALFCHPTPAA